MRDPEDEALLRYDELAIPAMWFGHVVALVVFVLAQLLPTVRNGAWQPYSALEMLGISILPPTFTRRWWWVRWHF